ncbi:hypothetical protein SMICM17S_12803 [Streptomyces microflavus]
MTAPSLLSPALRNYPWGSRTAIPALLGQQPDGEPQAELWFCAHRAAPSLLPDRPGHPDLAAAITADPAQELGEASLAAHGPELPFLLKLLAAEQALLRAGCTPRAGRRRHLADFPRWPWACVPAMVRICW